VGYRFLIIKFGVPDMCVDVIMVSRDATFFENEFLMKGDELGTSSQEPVGSHVLFVPIEHIEQTSMENPKGDNNVSHPNLKINLSTNYMCARKSNHIYSDKLQ
jgi:hypothetical protein